VADHSRTLELPPFDQLSQNAAVKRYAKLLVDSPLGVAEAEEVEDEYTVSFSQRRQDLPPDSSPARGSVHEDNRRTFTNNVERDLTDRRGSALCQRERHAAKLTPS
jgi:hypothetical protein